MELREYTDQYIAFFREDARALGLEKLSLTHNFVAREGAMLTAHQRDCAECASVIASFADFQVADMRKISRINANTGMQALGFRADHAALSKLLREPSALGCSKKHVDFRQSFRQLGLMPLDHAAHSNYCLAHTVGLIASRLEHRVDGFLLRRVDEAAGVDDDYIGFAELRRELAAVIRQLGQVSLGIDGILVAAERDEADFQVTGSYRI